MYVLTMIAAKRLGMASSLRWSATEQTVKINNYWMDQEDLAFSAAPP